MCQRYSIAMDNDTLTRYFEVEVPEGYQPNYNAAPSQLLPIITHDDPRGFSFFYWGMPPAWSKNKALSTKLYIADLEHLDKKASLKSAVKNRRCLVPADGFYLWKQISKKRYIPYRVFNTKEEPLCFAGLWEEFENEDNILVHCFKIITLLASDTLRPLSDRVPALLSKEQINVWMEPSEPVDQLIKALTMNPSISLGMYTVSPLVNSIANNSERVTKPSPAIDQLGNYTLFD